MGQDFYERSSAARQVFDEVAALTDTSFLDTIFSGSADELRNTQVTQLALLTVEAAIGSHLVAAGHRPAGVAGHSIGEFPALVAAGVLTLEAAVKLVQARARLMSEDVPAGAMAAVIGLAPDAIEAHLPEGVGVANYNGPGQTIISGTAAGVQEAQTTLKEAGAKRVIPLNVSGPFHSHLMHDAAERFREELGKHDFHPPTTRYISSVTAEDASEPEEIRALLGRQIASPVRWTEVMKLIGPARAIEVGPGNVLQGLARRMDGAPAVEPAGTLEAADALAID